MKLKRVKIFGFKTFADKTDISLDGKIIAVVGPNGCGKSNIVDSILWGLGETNARQLRAQTSQEVIFSGSVRRKPLGYAEVSLTFDNEDGALPIETAEVQVSRKLNRAGESEYSINRRPCRLKDVADLLADSGLGRAGYAIVGQSEIDQALAASAGQRRAWIDEAAGVQRYRARRLESVRRLEGAKQHLARVHDVLNEIERQRAPLEAEAETARSYKAAVQSLRQVECGLLAREHAQLESEIAELEERLTGTHKLSLDASAEIEKAEAEAIAADELAQKLEQRLELLRESQTRASVNLANAQSALHVAQHRLESLDELEGTLGEESAHAAARLAQAREEWATAQSEAEAEAAAFAALQAELAGVDDEAQALSLSLAQADKALEEARRRHQERQKIEVELAHREDRVKHIKVELQGIVATLPDLEQAVAEAQAALDAQERFVAEAEALIKQAEATLAQSRREEEQEAARTRQLLAETATLDGRRRGLEATVLGHEGLAQGARAVMAAVAQGMLPDVYAPVGTVVEVDPDLALALDTALGNAVNDLVVPDDRAAKEAIQILKEGRLGRATFQPVNLMRPSTPSPELRRLLNERGVVGLASELVRCEARFRPVVDSLLGRVVVVEELDDALRLARTSGWSRMVTMDGEVVHGSGAVTGGTNVRHSTGMVQRKAELAELEHQLSALQSDVAKMDRAKARRAEARAVAEESAREARDLAASRAKEKEEAKSWWLNLRHELQATVRSQDKLNEELKQLQALEAELPAAEDIAAVESARDAVLRQLAAKSSDVETASERLAEAESRSAQSARRCQEAERRLQHLNEAEEHRARRTANLEPERERQREAIALAEAEVAKHSAHVDETRGQVVATVDQRTASLDEANRLRQKARDAQKAVDGLAETMHRAELSRARADSKRASVVQRLFEEYGVGPEEAAAAQTKELPEDAAALVARLRREIKDMGEVNLGAIEAFERLTERHDELRGQVDDIEGGMEELHGSVRELDRMTRERFMATFDKIRDAFGRTFTTVFGGGEATLELSETENILDSGVEISVTVPGKRRQRLELLSGGERALSALAFLFALLSVKPSPLVVLDEVDAPLDGRNVERYIQLMRDFGGDTQFILITHNPVTIEAADVWFGVTMQEPGVSTLVPFRVPEPQVVRAVVPDAYLKG
ncbi:MAG: chromosome segregation protein SMC [Fimbriimonadaceae bacterium]|nr:chromosome segregation protein SMC [Fimbriimonadaceae bacterium]